MTERQRLEHAASKLSTQEELDDMARVSTEICDYIERCRSGDKLQLDGGIRGGVDHLLRNQAIYWLTKRPRELLDRDGETTPPSKEDSK